MEEKEGSSVTKILKILGLCLACYIAFHLLLVLIAFLLGGSMVLFSSIHSYGKDHKDLYTVAVNNVFGIKGHESNGEVSYAPEISVVETDQYGRTLFFYSEYYDNHLQPEPDYGMAFGVMQYSENGYAYYYPDQCCLPYFDTTDDWESISSKLPPDYLDVLKEANDWNRELDQDCCAKAKITKKQPKSKLDLKEADYNKVIRPYMYNNDYSGTDTSFYKFSYLCETDAYGRELHYVYGMSADPVSGGKTRYGNYVFAIIFNVDGTCPRNGIVEIKSPPDCIPAITKLKLDTNWNMSGS